VNSIQVFIKLDEQTVDCPQTKRSFWRIGNPSLSTQEIQKTMQRTSTEGKAADHGWDALTAGQMLPEKPVHMVWANLSPGDLPLREPSSEMRHDSAIQVDGTRGVTSAAEIASEGLGNYVNLTARFLFTIAGTPTRLILHSESRKPSGFQGLAILPPTKLSSKKKPKNAPGESAWCT
jgi:hypothetical protein